MKKLIKAILKQEVDCADHLKESNVDNLRYFKGRGWMGPKVTHHLEEFEWDFPTDLTTVKNGIRTWSQHESI